jgi:hypothetical protein
LSRNWSSSNYSFTDTNCITFSYGNCNCNSFSFTNRDRYTFAKPDTNCIANSDGIRNYIEHWIYWHIRKWKSCVCSI